MEKKNLIVGAVIIFLVAIMFFLFLGDYGSYDNFAQCLTDSGAKMFGTYWCPHCKVQKEMFGSSFKNINYVECSLPDGTGQTQICADEGIKGYPTWELENGSRIEGGLSLKRLATLSKCELKKDSRY